MRSRPLHAPTWVLCLAGGVPTGATWIGWSLLDGDGWVPAVVQGVFFGTFFGLFIGPVTQRMARRQSEAVGDLPAGTERATRRATWRGSVPDDPQVRAAALRLVEQSLVEFQRLGGWSFAAFAVATVLYVVLAVTSSAWWWLAAGFFVGMLALLLLWPARLERRAELLRAGMARSAG